MAPKGWTGRTVVPQQGSAELTPAIVGCVTYRTSVLPDNLQTIYFSGIQRRVPGDEKRSFPIVTQSETSAAHLRFRGAFIRDGGIATAQASSHNSEGSQ